MRKKLVYYGIKMAFNLMVLCFIPKLLPGQSSSEFTKTSDNMNDPSIISIQKLDFLWPVSNPFLFCAHHLDHYPAGGENYGPDPSQLKGRDIGQDFTIQNGWRMYHGETIPGFPVHPHRGFETVTIVLEGMVDHSDSHGQAGRYGGGDVQWMTAGAGLQHCEMFPLIHQTKGNTLELFQVWLNLPRAKKFADPHFKMLLSEDIPKFRTRDSQEKVTEVNVIAGKIEKVNALSPAPDSWAADPANEVNIWTIKMQAGAEWRLPISSSNLNRTLYFYRGSSVKINETTVKPDYAVQLVSDAEVVIRNGETDAFLFVLQGKPIDEPVVNYGPFVMNTEEEIRQAISDYRKTEFGGWPWPRPDVIHGDRGRFARHKDGSEEIK